MLTILFTSVLRLICNATCWCSLDIWLIIYLLRLAFDFDPDHDLFYYILLATCLYFDNNYNNRQQNNILQCTCSLDNTVRISVTINFTNTFTISILVLIWLFSFCCICICIISLLLDSFTNCWNFHRLGAIAFVIAFHWHPIRSSGSCYAISYTYAFMNPVPKKKNKQRIEKAHC